MPLDENAKIVVVVIVAPAASSVDWVSPEPAPPRVPSQRSLTLTSDFAAPSA